MTDPRHIIVLISGIAVLYVLYETKARPVVTGLVGIVVLGLILANWPAIHQQFNGLWGKTPQKGANPQ